MVAILLSIHKKYSDLILLGQKTIEVRRTAIKKNPSIALIYSTNSKRIVGAIKIIQIIRCDRDSFFKSYSEQTCLTKHDYETYLENCEMVTGIVFGNLIKQLDLKLSDLCIKNAPQSFMYVDKCSIILDSLNDSDEDIECAERIKTQNF